MRNKKIHDKHSEYSAFASASYSIENFTKSNAVNVLNIHSVLSHLNDKFILNENMHWDVET